MTGPLALFAVLLCGGTAGAQSLAVRNATPGSTIELAVNASSVASAAADAIGDAMLAVPALAGVRADPLVQVFVDRCSDRVRVVIVEPAGTPLPAGACTRREAAGRFVARSVTTFVVDVSNETPAVRVSQGPAPPEWFRPGAAVFSPSLVPEAGLLLSANTGLFSFGDTLESECGNVSSCGGTTRRNGIAGGASYWFSRAVGVGFVIARPRSMAIRGQGQSFEFDTRVQTERLIVADVLAGVPIGRVRIYGRGGINHHRATTSTLQTINAATVVVGGVEQAIPGGSQRIVRTTSGIGWSAGGGLEVWLASRFALYGEAGFHALKGDEISGGDARLDTRVPFMQFGGRFRLF